MPSVSFRTQAAEDLDVLLDNSLVEYGAEVARKRREMWADAVRLLGDVPTVGQSCDHIDEGLRRYVVMPHAAYFRLTHEGVVIVRILHVRQDAERLVE